MSAKFPRNEHTVERVVRVVIGVGLLSLLLTIARNAGYRLRLAASLRRESEQMEPVRLDVIARLLEQVRQMGNES